MENLQLKSIIQAALLAASKTLTVENLVELFSEEEEVTAAQVKEILSELQQDEDNCFILKELASGFRYQVKSDYAKWISHLWQERPPRYSRALLETLVIIAYRQPVTRADIEDIRGVAVSTHIIKTLLEREWIRVVGQRDVPGKPSIYGTTKEFLDYFNLTSLNELPTLDEIKSIDEIAKQIDMPLEEDAQENEEVQSADTKASNEIFEDENPTETLVIEDEEVEAITEQSDIASLANDSKLKEAEALIDNFTLNLYPEESEENKETIEEAVELIEQEAALEDNTTSEDVTHLEEQELIEEES